MRNRIIIGILLVAGCESITPGQVGFPCELIVKHDTIEVIKRDTISMVKIQQVEVFNLIRDTIFVRCDTEFIHINNWDN